MKKILIIAGILAGTFYANLGFAQQTVNLNITLSDVLSFSVTQPAALTVDFNTAEKYSEGISVTAPSHITVTSNKGYVVKAVAGSVSGASGLEPSSVSISAALGQANTGSSTGHSFTPITALPASGSSAASLIASSGSSWNGANASNTFDVTYVIGANGAYAGKTLGSNVIPVVYTVTQP